MERNSGKPRNSPESSAPRPPVICLITVLEPEHSSDPCFEGLVYSLERGICLARGETVHLSFPGLAIGDSGFNGHSRLPFRDLLADLVEYRIRSLPADGLVLVGDQNEGLAGLLMASVRLNLPAIVVPASADLPTGDGASATQANYSSRAVACLAETMGLCFPMASTVPSGKPEQFDLAVAAGKRAVELAYQNFSIRRLLMSNAFHNAIRFDAALGGSSEAVIFLSALAQECGIKLGLDAFDVVAKKTPQLGWFPGGKAAGINNFHSAGGVQGVLGAMKGEWLPHATVCGRGITDLAKIGKVKDPHGLRCRNPHRKDSGLKILKGNLAPVGAILRSEPGVHAKQETLQVSARVFDSRETVMEALQKKEIRKGQAVVLRYEGAKGGPGLRPLEAVIRTATAHGVDTTIPFITDGAWGSPLGPYLAVELVSPEAAEGSTLSILKDGDRIEIDLSLRKLHVFLTDTEQKVRLARWQAPRLRANSGYLLRYARSVGAALEGASVK